MKKLLISKTVNAGVKPDSINKWWMYIASEVNKTKTTKLCSH